MSEPFEHWLEAAYVYYLRPELDPVMFDAQWDMLSRAFEKNPPRHPLIEKFRTETGDIMLCSAFHLREEDYPDWIREKYKDV